MILYESGADNMISVRESQYDTGVGAPRPRPGIPPRPPEQAKIVESKCKRVIRYSNYSGHRLGSLELQVIGDNRA